MSQERTGLSRDRDSETGLRTIVKIHEELLAAPNIDRDTQSAVRAVAQHATDAIHATRNCKLGLAMGSLIRAENIGTMLKVKVRESALSGKVSPDVQRQFNRQVADMIKYAKDSVVYELKSSCRCACETDTL